MSKRVLISFILIIPFLLAFQQFARRVLPVFSDPSSPCTEGSIYYHMLEHKFLICTNTGIQEVAVGAAGGVIPIANATTTGRLSNTDWVIFNNKQNVLGFTPENIANKNATSGYAGLSGGKVALSQISEVISSLDLSDYSTSSGTGNTAIRSTVSLAATNDVLTWNGTNWVNAPPIVFSVFGRNGNVTAQSGDYNASQVINAFNVSTANTLINVAAPSNPGVGALAIWADSTDTVLKVKNSSGVIATVVKPLTCTGTDKVSAITSAGTIVCSADQSGGGGSGITSLNGLIAATQTFATTNDTNINLVINSVSDTHTFIVSWTGVLSKSRMTSTTVHTDQANTFGAFTQTFQAGALFNLVDPTTTSKIARFDLSNISTATTRTINIPNANSTTVQSSTAPTDQFATSISAQGVVGYTQPSFSNLSGSATDAQVPNNISLTAIPNLTTNGFIKTSAVNGTLVIDTSTYLTGNQTITLTGNVTGSGTTSITTTIANNVVTGAMIALGSDAQGDIMFYNGTDWTRLPAGTSGQVLQTQGVGANPIWATAGTGDMILSATQTVTGAKTFDPAKLIVGSVSIDPAVVIGSFYRDSDDGKLYFGVDDTVDFWGEVFIAGQSSLNLASNVTGVLGEANGGTGNTSWDYVALTDGATITWTVSGIVNNATVTLGGNRTLAFSGLSNGMTGTIIIKQDATGSRTITLPASSKVIGGGSGAITLTTTANAIDILSWTYDGTNIYWTYGKNYN